jgi:SAM-dependent methyltransferase
MEGYGEDLAAIHSAGFTAIAEAAARELLSRLEPQSRVLELGCGDGTTARLLSEAGHDVHGLDSSPAFVELARANAPKASLRVGSFIDAPLPTGCDAVLAIGEVLGYLGPAPAGAGDLGRLLDRIAGALRAGGLLLFDLAASERVPRAGERTWTEGERWAVLVDASLEGAELRRRIVAFRDLGDGRYRRTEELHRLRLHRRSEVLGSLRTAGFAARTLPRGYGGEPLPRGLVAYLARKR